jgi:hypothetical protein
MQYQWTRSRWLPRDLQRAGPSDFSFCSRDIRDAEFLPAALKRDSLSSGHERLRRIASWSHIHRKASGFARSSVRRNYTSGSNRLDRKPRMRCYSALTRRYGVARFMR